jgi:hypothetical protein
MVDTMKIPSQEGLGWVEKDCFSASGPSPKAMAAGDRRIAMTLNKTGIRNEILS